MKEALQQAKKDVRQAESDLVVKIQGLKISFGSKEVLKDFNLELRKGENLVILGKSGTGKSVLIKCLVKLLDIDEGQVNILGNDLRDLDRKQLNELRKRIGFLFQSAALYDSMTVRENLMFPLRMIPSQSKEDLEGA